MIKELYRRYFQKSHTLLYPLLKIKKHSILKSSKTYIEWEGVIKKEDRKLICLFVRDKSEQWKDFEKEVLINHPMLDFTQEIDENIIIYVFDFNSMPEDFDNFIQGKYSLYSPEAKKRLMDYYGTWSPEWVYIESYIYPDKYFKDYSKILNVDEKILRKVGELCEKYDEIEEKCLLSLPQKLKLKKVKL